MVDFYLTIFRQQMAWRDRLVVEPEEVSAEHARESFREGRVLSERYDPGIGSDSLLQLWTQMKTDFRSGNEVLREAVDKIDEAEKTGTFAPAAWLLDQRPGRQELVTEAADRIGVDESVLATLARSVTFPHWELVSEAWLPDRLLNEWKRAHCPVCGCVPGLGEIRKESGEPESTTSVTRRFMHCAFCGSRWVVPPLKCPACGSTKSGDAKYLFTDEEPDLRIDFCDSCHHYVKVVDGGKMSGRIHIGLELLTAAHLDVIARDKNLSPLEVGT
jgi:FdhE protein